MRKVVTSGGRTITIESAIYTPQTDETKITIYHSMGKRPLESCIFALDRTQCRVDDVGYTFVSFGVGWTTSSIPSSGARAYGLSGTAISLYAVAAYNDRVEFLSYDNTNPFRAGIEYCYNITWVD